MAEGSADIPVRVAVRARPLILREISEGCQQCLQFVPGEPQVILGRDKAFTYDYAFGPTDSQEKLYDEAVSGLVGGIFKGLNATVLAYGQTGSGKTYSMGSGYDLTDTQKMGVIPRVVKSLFEGIKERSETADFILKCSFLELHNDDILDLLQEDRAPLAVREDTNGEIKITGLSEMIVHQGTDMIALLEKGSAGRTTGSTAMNATSSRSHAIFTIHIEQCSKDDSIPSCHAKFHLVDLAGSERAKRTQAKGDRFKEGVNINKGLLALGNVISALGDENGRKQHIPYRDSKLTRLLQDSLGGNSQTVMIACVSPADSNMEETLNTLRYADRARKIKNKPVVNSDPQAAELARLRQQVQQLQYQVLSNGGVLPPVNPASEIADSATMTKLLERNKKLEDENQKLSVELQASLDQTTQMCEKAILAEMNKDKLKQKLEQLRAKTDLSISLFNTSLEEATNSQAMQPISILEDLRKQIDDLKSEPMETENVDLFEMEVNDAFEGTPPKNNDNSGDGNPGQGDTPLGVASPNLANQALRQAQLGRELQELNKALALKQELAMKMGQSDEKMEVMKLQYEANIKTLEGQIEALQNEKDTLSIALQNNKSLSATSKISEQRRQRMKELEGEISNLKKKVAEQNKLIRLKARSDDTINKLNKDIQSMKQARVKLMRQIKEDAEKTRQWKMAKDKEVLQLKAKDRKRQCDITKMERKYEKQQNVLRRKMEEAAAANKRLKEAMERHKAHSKKKPEPQGVHRLEGMGKRIKTLLERELDVLVGVNEAKRHLASLLADRKTISQELLDLKEQQEAEPPNKKRATPEKSLATFNTETQRKIQTLQQELDMRNVQITDLQQKIMDANQDEQNRKCWQNITSMAEAKCGLKWLMETAVLARVEVGTKTSELEEVKQALCEAGKETEELQANLEDTMRHGDQRVTELQRGHEEKILYLLHQLSQVKTDADDKSEVPRETANTSKNSETELLSRLHFQEEQISQLQDIHNQLIEVQKENAELKKQLTLSCLQGTGVSLLPDITSPESTPQLERPKLKPKVKKRASSKKESPSRRTVHEFYLIPESDSSEEDNDDQDEDWVKTPKVKRKPSKSHSKWTCSCKGNCQNKRCGCKSRGRFCSDDCLCNKGICVNVGSAQDESGGSLTTSQANSSVGLNDTIIVSSSSENATPDLDYFQPPRRKPTSILSESSRNIPWEENVDKDDTSTKPLVTNLADQGLVKRKRKLLNTTRTSFFKPLN
ncbi:Chromosome-associated kinesin KIF4 [Holothuria leucospilota]|uniref:Chromosome-associated kinesin KIF4 n=1 Tax=Holothuria leucospilota TaxID=206669 RepID=A0A9Q1BKS6_HOLLE|nr:Chromosome-associated kinesin KIF4 [Holothuria leucospilota]